MYSAKSCVQRPRSTPWFSQFSLGRLFLTGVPRLRRRRHCSTSLAKYGWRRSRIFSRGHGRHVPARLFLDFFEIIFVVVPIVGPVLLGMGLDPIWFGVMIALNLQTSFLTPPFGFSLFYLRGVALPPSAHRRFIEVPSPLSAYSAFSYYRCGFIPNWQRIYRLWLTNKAVQPPTCTPTPYSYTSTPP